ncbi:kinase-like domain-containing protein [Lophiotrema nucula]|uniref:Kinase-like domain-containing protein n=1 Tax=Lophiotrema nucula TaxID=690887 RepID=A0A6A5Z652_9PLEO|nr:kinase-like domain-containing protein [Lophiotrema nucula]
MAPISQIEKDAIADQTLKFLSKTPYACSTLTPLSGGTTNFVYRGSLASPSPAHAKHGSLVTTVIIKRATDFVSANQDFKLDPSRSAFEEVMLNAVDGFPPITTLDGLVIKAPKLYFFDRETNTQVLEDIPGSTDLLKLLNTLSFPAASSIGRALGSWLKAFHDWTSEPEQTALRTELAKNKSMQELKSKITYEMFIPVLERNFPEILERHQEILEEVRAAVAEELTREDKTDLGESWSIVHGDFWMGNVLLPDPTPTSDNLPNSTLYIIDFEFAQLSHRSLDLGQIVGDIYERDLLPSSPRASPLSLPLLQAFIAGYGPLSEDLAYRTAIHAGIHLIGVLTRRDPSTAWLWPREEVEGLMSVAVCWIVKGWQRDGGWFGDSVLARLFIRT